LSKVDNEELCRVDDALCLYEKAIGVPSGIQDPDAREAFLHQVVDSRRRSRFIEIKALRAQAIHAEPQSLAFDAHSGTAFLGRTGEIDEAVWLLFLATHFGKHRKSGWAYVAAVYGQLGEKTLTWKSVEKDPGAVTQWLDCHYDRIRSGGGGFSNHRKYESLKGSTENGTGAVIESFVTLANQAGGPARLFEPESPTDRKGLFDLVYQRISPLHRFGRTAKFDLLVTAGKLGNAQVEPSRLFLVGSTGPARGAKRFWGKSDLASKDLESRAAVLESFLLVGFDAIEDALCNWQKSPAVVKRFRG
jgi:Alpha-glutamyl/putrescinyl thymine pyrophosphorylase clade 3